MARTRGVHHTAHALLLRRVDYAESDLVLTLFTNEQGRVSALARGARASRKRFSGSLEPMHTLQVRLDQRPSAELMLLREASLHIPRRVLLGDLAALRAAGRALGWVRHVAAPHTPDLGTWETLNRLLDALNTEQQTLKAEHHLAHAGFQLLTCFGWPLEFSRCVRCGRRCPPDQKAMVDPVAGGLICRACGGAQILLGAGRRRRLAEAAEGAPALREHDVPQALNLVEQALRAHAGMRTVTDH